MLVDADARESQGLEAVLARYPCPEIKNKKQALVPLSARNTQMPTHEAKAVEQNNKAESLGRTVQDRKRT